ncbi:MAG: hypothetical protein J7641_19200 [Cyanobacteria bacterium SID2]|nr:hypothetical protein [Cyanobacteria bacterium SID2]MBP0004027.1 hypothetical protein [Cyanobacteria bacterium SBC]
MCERRLQIDPELSLDRAARVTRGDATARSNSSRFAKYVGQTWRSNSSSNASLVQPIDLANYESTHNNPLDRSNRGDN